MNKPINVTATVKAMKTIQSEVSSKDRLQGLLMDGSGKIDFIAWGSDVERVAQSVEENQTFVFTNVKVNTCNAKFCSTTSGLQLVFTHRTSIEKSATGPLQSYVSVTPLRNLLQCADKKVNIAGKICNIQKVTDKRRKSSDRLIVSVRDENMKIDACFYGSSGDSFTGQIGDVIVIENVAVKNYGTYNVVNATKATYQLNEMHDNIQGLKNVNLQNPIETDLSPRKNDAEEVSNLENLQDNTSNQTQQFTATPINLAITIYNSCPLVSCKKKVHSNEEANVFTCDKCKKIYRVAAKGIIANIEVEKDTKTTTLTMFNEIAEQLLGMSGEDIERQGLHENSTELLAKIGHMHSFQVTNGKVGNEFIITDFDSSPPLPQHSKQQTTVSTTECIHVYTPATTTTMKNKDSSKKACRSLFTDSHEQPESMPSLSSSRSTAESALYTDMPGFSQSKALYGTLNNLHQSSRHSALATNMPGCWQSNFAYPTGTSHGATLNIPSQSSSHPAMYSNMHQQSKFAYSSEPSHSTLNFPPQERLVKFNLSSSQPGTSVPSVNTTNPYCPWSVPTFQNSNTPTNGRKRRYTINDILSD